MTDKNPSQKMISHWQDTHNRNKTPIQTFDIRIAKDGAWYHQGRLIERKEMIMLFASVLTQFDDGRYGLVTPTEIGVITVEEAPFIITGIEVSKPGKQQKIHFTTSLDDKVTLGAKHPLTMKRGNDTIGEKPYVLVRNGLKALVSRPVYYDLCAFAISRAQELGVVSDGVFFPLYTEDAKS